MLRSFRVFLVLFVVLLTGVFSYTRLSTPAPAYAATSSNLNFQARLLNSAGNTVPDGYYNIEFKLYSVASGGSSLWSESYYDSNGATAGNDNRVRVVNGYLSVNLGSQTAFPAINWDQDMWLTMNVGNTAQVSTCGVPFTAPYSSNACAPDGEMNPRIKLTSVPYAFQAKQAENLNKTTAGGGVGTVDFSSLTADRKFLFPDTNLATTASPGTVCVFNGAVSNCPAATGSASYIQNSIGGATPQTEANFNIQAYNSGTDGTVGGRIRGAANGQTVDLFQLQASNGTVLTHFDATGRLAIGTAAAPTSVLTVGTDTTTASGGITFGTDTTLYRSAANTLTTGGSLVVTNDLVVNGAVTGPEWGSLFLSTGDANAIGDAIRFKVDTDPTPGVIALQEIAAFDSTGLVFGPVNNPMYITGPQFRTLTIQSGDTNDATDEIGFDIDTNIAGGTSAYTRVLTVDSANGGSIGIGSTAPAATLHVSSSNAAPLFRITDATATVTDVVNIADGGAATFRNQTNSTAAFQVQNAAGYQILNIDTATNTNMLANPGFEVDTSGWTARTGTTLTRTTTEDFYGVAGGSLVNTATANAGVNYPVTLAPSTAYAFSFYTKLASGTMTTMQAGRADNGVETACTLSTATTLTTGWTRHTCTFTTGATISGSYVFIRQSDAVARTVYLDAARLETGTVAKPYSFSNISLAGTINTPAVFQSASDSTTAFQVQNAAGTSNSLVVDTINNSVGIGRLPVAGYSLYANSNIGTGGWVYSTNGLIIPNTSNSSGTIMKYALAGASGNTQYDVVVLANEGGNIRASQTTTARDSRVYGIAYGTIAAAGTNNIVLGGNYTVNVDAGAVAIGDQLVTSTTAGRATVDNKATTGIIGTALSSKVAGANGTVSIIVRPVGGQDSPTFRNATDTAAAFQIQNAGGQNLLVADTSTQQLAVGPAAVAANGVLTIGTDTTSASGGLYFGTDTNLYRSATNTLKTDEIFELAATSASGGYLSQAGNRILHTTGGTTNFFAGTNAGNLTVTGLNNTGVGNNALLAVTSGSHNSAFGFQALQANTTGYENMAIGSSALLSNTSGFMNVAVGRESLASNTTGSHNVALGKAALFANQTGNYNTAVGKSALENSLGNYNSALGYQALYLNTGHRNTAVGYLALNGTGAAGTNTGANNVALGYQAGVTGTAANANTSGSRNTFIGNDAGPGSTLQLQNATAIGTYAVVNQNDSLVLGCINGINGCTASTKIGIGTAEPSEVLHVKSEGNAVIRLEAQNISQNSSGPNYAASVVNDSSTGVTAWTNPANAGADDGSVASVTLNNSRSQYLKATSFGFSIPTNATITGIRAEVKKGIDPAFYDGSVKLVKGGVVTGTDKADFSGWPNSLSYSNPSSYGGTSDLWGTTWTPSDINANNFGLAFAAEEIDGTNRTAQIDAMRITVYYTSPGGTYSSWTSGIDQNDSSAYKISSSSTIGTNTALRIGAINGDVLFKNTINSNIAFQIQNSSAQSLFVADTTAQRIAVGPAAVAANGVLTVGTDTTAASGGMYFGTDTNLYRSAANTLKTDDNFVVASEAGLKSIGFTTSVVGGTNRFDLDGGYDGLQGGSGMRTQLYSYYGLDLSGNTRNTAPALVSGTSDTFSVRIAAAAATDKGLIIQGAASQTADLMQLQNSSGTILTSFDKDGKLVFGPSGAQDTNLYRVNPNVLKTDDAFLADVYIQAYANQASQVTLGRTASGVAGAGITFGSAQDTNIYRSTDNTLKTDDNFIVQTATNSSAGFLVQNAAGTNLIAVNTTDGYVINNGTRSPGNELENPSFESGGTLAEAGYIGATAPYALTTDSTNARSGNRFASVTANSTNLALSPTKLFAVTPGDEIYFEAYVKNTAGTTGTSLLFFEFLDKDKTNATYPNFSTGYTGSQPTYVLDTLRGTVPADKYYVRVYLSPRTNSTTGTWHYDDLYFKRVTEQSPMVFKNSKDSTTALQVLQADGGAFINMDTVNNSFKLTDQNNSKLLEVSNATGFQVKTGGTGAWTNLGSTTSANILNLYNGSNVAVATFGSTGNALFKASTDAATAFQVQKAGAGGALFTVDTAGDDVEIAAGVDLRIGGAQMLYTAASSDLLIGNYNTGGTVYFQTDAILFQNTNDYSINFEVNNNGEANFKNRSNSATAFRIQNASAADTLFTVDTTTANQIKIGNSTGTGTATTQFVLDSATTAPSADGAGVNGAMYYDSTLGRIQCYEGGSWGRCSAIDQAITLTPEYAGAVLTGDGSNNTGTMTSDFCSGTTAPRLNINPTICGATEEHTYYSWTAQATNDYDIYIRYQLPSDFAGFSSSTAIQMFGRRSSSTEKVKLSMYNSAGTQCGTTTELNSADNSWQQTALAGDETACSGLTAGSIVLFKINMEVGTNNNFVRAGAINFSYKSK